MGAYSPEVGHYVPTPRDRAGGHTTWASKLVAGDVFRLPIETARGESLAHSDLWEIVTVTPSPDNSRVVCLHVRNEQTGKHRFLPYSYRKNIKVIHNYTLSQEAS